MTAHRQNYSFLLDLTGNWTDLSINLPRLYLPGVDQTESLSLPKDYKQNNNIDLKINIS